MSTILEMTGQRPSVFFKLCWKYFTPSLLLVGQKWLVVNQSWKANGWAKSFPSLLLPNAALPVLAFPCRHVEGQGTHQKKLLQFFTSRSPSLVFVYHHSSPRSHRFPCSSTWLTTNTSKWTTRAFTPTGRTCWEWLWPSPPLSWCRCGRLDRWFGRQEPAERSVSIFFFFFLKQIFSLCWSLLQCFCFFLDVSEIKLSLLQRLSVLCRPAEDPAWRRRKIEEGTETMTELNTTAASLEI